MSGDEVAVMVAAIAVGVGGWVVSLRRWSQIVRLRPRGASLGALGLTGIACGALLYVVLKTAASADVREAPAYIVMYLALGLAWTRLAAWLMPYAGLSIRDDLVERGNPAAVPAIAGALIATTLGYAGGNIGNGPGWWVVVFSAALATAGLGVVWIVTDGSTGVTDAVTIDRDPAAGVRLGGLLVASGLVLGRAVAGDWYSAPETIADFGMTAWGVVPLVVLAWVIERSSTPTAERPRAPFVPFGVAPAALYLAFAAAFVWWLGWPA